MCEFIGGMVVMKIGIISFHRALNYGASLQAYALQKVIKGLGNNGEHIDFRQPYVEETDKAFSFSSGFIKGLVKGIVLFNFRKNQREVFNDFWGKYMQFSKRIESFEDAESYDAYIVGSDQVWNTEITEFDTAYILENVTNESLKISYAASIGLEKLSSNHEEYLKEGIRKFDSLSVREESAKQILQKFTKNDISVALDPTLLLSKKEWLSELKQTEKLVLPEKYILAFQLKGDTLMKQTVDKASRELQLPVINIISLYSNSIVDKFKGQAYSPQDFVHLFNNAELILTNSFHGTAFSVNFNKKFYSVASYRPTRIINLLDKVGIEGHIITDEKDIPDFKNEIIINWSKTNQLLSEMRQESLDFLSKSLIK